MGAAVSGRERLAIWQNLYLCSSDRGVEVWLYDTETIYSVNLASPLHDRLESSEEQPIQRCKPQCL